MRVLLANFTKQPYPKHKMCDIFPFYLHSTTYKIKLIGQEAIYVYMNMFRSGKTYQITKCTLSSPVLLLI